MQREHGWRLRAAGLWRSVDHARWHKVALPDDVLPRTIYPDPKRAGHLVIESQETEGEPGMARGGWVYVTNDGGATWKQLAFPEDSGIEPGEGEHESLTFTIAIVGSTDHLRLWTPKDGSDDEAMWETTDGGTTWREQPKVKEPARPTEAHSINNVTLKPSPDGILVIEPGRARPRRVYPK